MENTRIRSCSFCGRREDDVSILIPSKDGKSYICDHCIDVCADFLDENYTNAKDSDDTLTLETLPRPKEIKAMLDEYVIGQNGAKLIESSPDYEVRFKIIEVFENFLNKIKS